MIVVTGATGNVGKPLVEALAGAGEQVTAVARTLPEDIPAGVRGVAADLTTPSTLRPAFEGAKALFLLTAPDLLKPGAGIDDILVEAKSAGIARVVLLSSLGVVTGRHPDVFEDAIRESGLAWTILRPGNFASNAWQWAEQVRRNREIAAPFGDVGLPAVDPTDIAEVAVAVLRGDGHDGQAYVLTGLETISPRQQAAVFAGEIGEPVEFRELSRDTAFRHMSEFMPEQVVRSTLDILGTPTEAETRISPDVERILGRAPRPFAEWVRRNGAAFR